MNTYVKKKDVLPVLDKYWVLWYECNDEYNELHFDTTSVSLSGKYLKILKYGGVEYHFTNIQRTHIVNTEGITLYDSEEDMLYDYMLLSENVIKRKEKQIADLSSGLSKWKKLVDKHGRRLDKLSNVNKLINKI